jgi:hypothetical protein
MLQKLPELEFCNRSLSLNAKNSWTIDPPFFVISPNLALPGIRGLELREPMKPEFLEPQGLKASDKHLSD